MPEIERREIERRILTDARFEVRQAGEESAPMLVGYAARYNQDSEEIAGFVERIEPGAFSKSIGGDVRALFNHDPNLILGRTRSGSLRLTDDADGLRVEIDPPDTNYARDLFKSIERGDVSQMSFGFRTITDKWEEMDGGNVRRTLLDVELFDVSPVTFPAYPQTDIAVRSLQQWRDDHAPDFSIRKKLLRLAEAEL